MVETPHGDDAARRVPVYSLYSDTREPTAEMLRDIDVLVIDLQDIGARIYTYIYTMANCLRAAARHGVPVVVCDRPNPIGGEQVEGASLSPGFESFVGQFPIPMRHGMTIGELAALFNDRFGMGASLEIAQMERWDRRLYADETGLPWVMPSPNMPTIDAAVVYPGTVLFEGTLLSEGRGTTRPFELVGAPWIDPDRCAAAMNALELPGVYIAATIVAAHVVAATGFPSAQGFELAFALSAGVMVLAFLAAFAIPKTLPYAPERPVRSEGIPATSRLAGSTASGGSQ
jgi:uncharacterized protein YbbC (DUF1343 family)